MLSHRRRLRAGEVVDVLKKGRRCSSPSLSMRYLPEGMFSAAVVVRKGIAKKAVLRNRIRRAVYRALSSTPLPQTGKAVFFVERVPEGSLTPVFRQDIATLLAKLT